MYFIYHNNRLKDGCNTLITIDYKIVLHISWCHILYTDNNSNDNKDNLYFGQWPYREYMETNINLK